MFSGRLTNLFEYLQVLEVIPAGKGKKNFEIYQGKQYLKARLDCYKTANLAVYIHEEKTKIFPAKIFGYDISFSNEYFCLLTLCCTSTFVLWL